MTIIRVHIYKYIKSGKYSAIGSLPGAQERIVADLSWPDYKVLKWRTLKYVRRDDIEGTGIVAEIEAIKTGAESFSFNFIRAISLSDLELSKWESDIPLVNLPISLHPDLTSEEMYWAGKRDGEYAAIWLSVFGVLLFLAAFQSSEGGLGYLVLGLFLIGGAFKKGVKWAQDATPDKIEEVRKRKLFLREQKNKAHQNILTKVRRASRDFHYWRSLTPDQFEHHVAILLRSKGFNVTVTKYTGDGGIDLEGASPDGLPCIIQVKKYATNVGVAAIREIVGVRSNMETAPKTYVVALMGFTRGAKVFAENNNVLLLSIKDIIAAT